MANLKWNGDDFRNSKDSSGATADLISHSGKLQQGYQHGSLTDGLVAYYPMEKGEGEILHNGALNNTGQINGASWNSTGKIGTNSITFDSTGEEITIGDAQTTPLNQWTVAYWAMPSSTQTDSSSTWKGIVSNSDANNNGGWSCHYKHDVSDWVITHSGDYPYNNGLNVTANADQDQWQLMIWTYDGNKVKLYKNGVLKDSDTGTQTYESLTKNLTIGKYIWQGDHRYWDGGIEDVRIYDRALTQPEITTLYNQANGRISGREQTEDKVPNQDQGGVSRYRFNGDVNDAWGSNDGTDNTSKGYVTGVYGQAKDFNGTDDEITFDESTAPDLDQLTISFWYYIDSIGNEIPGILAKYEDFSSATTDDSNFLFQAENRDVNTSGLKALIGDSSTSASVQAPKDSVNTGVWKHLTLTYNQSQLRLYYNGRSVDVTNSSIIPHQTNSDVMRFGNDMYDRFLDGKLDDIRIYNTALTPQQVEQLYNLGSYRISRRSTLQ